jgi:hypothetical protein
VLAGGDPVPVREPRATQPAGEIPADDPVVEYVRHLPGLSPTSREALEHVARSPGLDAATRRALVAMTIAMWEQGQGEEHLSA